MINSISNWLFSFCVCWCFWCWCDSFCYYWNSLSWFFCSRCLSSCCAYCFNWSCQVRCNYRLTIDSHFVSCQISFCNYRCSWCFWSWSFNFNRDSLIISIVSCCQDCSRVNQINVCDLIDVSQNIHIDTHCFSDTSQSITVLNCISLLVITYSDICFDLIYWTCCPVWSFIGMYVTCSKKWKCCGRVKKCLCCFRFW